MLIDLRILVRYFIGHAQVDFGVFLMLRLSFRRKETEVNYHLTTPCQGTAYQHDLVVMMRTLIYTEVLFWELLEMVLFLLF